MEIFFMPKTQLSAKLGANNGIYDHLEPTHVKRSEFPLSEKADFHCDAGMIVPFYLNETLPGDVWEINLRYLLKSFPMVVAPFTSYRIRFHFYYTKLTDLWRGAHTLLTKGNAGDIELTVPTINPYRAIPSFYNSYSDDVLYCSPQSLSAYLGFPPFAVNHVHETDNGYNEPYSQLFEDDEYYSDFFTPQPKIPYGGVSALPFLFYQKIYRSAYVIPNLLQNSKAWFPDDLTDGWRINYAKTNLNSGSGGTPVYAFHPTALPDDLEEHVSAPVPSSEDTYINLLQLRYGLFEDDRFTTAIPQAIRGSAPVLDVEGSALTLSNVSMSGNIPSVGIKYESDDLSFSSSDLNAYNSSASQNARSNITLGAIAGIGGVPTAQGKLLTDSQRVNFTNGSATATVNGLKFTLNQLRELMALSVWQERNERIQAGDYNQFIYAHFKYDPQSDDHEPIYIGGVSDVISFGDVIQTSETTDSSPLGKMAGNAASQASGQIARFKCHDYGYLMGVCIISPETVYSQAIPKLWTRLQQEDFYFPEDEGLGLEEILNREIFPLNNTTDNNLWAYNERNTEYKASMNKALGWFGVNPDQDALGARDLAPYSQGRVFTSRPELSHQFVTMSPENMRRDAFAAPSMPEFRLSVATQIRAIRPMSYRNIPNTFGF